MNDEDKIEIKNIIVSTLKDSDLHFKPSEKTQEWFNDLREYNSRQDSRLLCVEKDMESNSKDHRSILDHVLDVKAMSIGIENQTKKTNGAIKSLQIWKAGIVGGLGVITFLIGILTTVLIMFWSDYIEIRDKVILFEKTAQQIERIESSLQGINKKLINGVEIYEEN